MKKLTWLFLTIVVTLSSCVTGKICDTSVVIVVKNNRVYYTKTAKPTILRDTVITNGHIISRVTIKN